MEGTMEEQREGRTARAIERQTSRIPSDVFLWTGVGAIAASLTLAAGQVSSIYLTDEGTLSVSTGGYPATAHVRLATVTTGPGTVVYCRS